MVKIKLRIHNFNSSIGLDLFDRYYAYLQSLDPKNYRSKFEIEYGPPQTGRINIAFSYFPTQHFCNFNDYDFVFVDNAGESLETATEYISESIRHDNVYFICGAFLDNDHPLQSKIIPFNHCVWQFRDCITRGFYPQYYSQAQENYNPSKNMIFVNGANRSWRKYFIDQLIQAKLDVDIESNMGSIVKETKDCMFEDKYDTKFRKELANIYPKGMIGDYIYADHSVAVGIDKKYGQVQLGLFIHEAYYNYHCVIFPETAWINNQHFATEKIYKCCVTGAIPFPISGAKTHQFYNAHGFQTAWNLLPQDLRLFDDEPDHQKRYGKIVTAIRWLENNPDIFKSQAATDLRKQNRLHFYSHTSDLISVKKLDQVLKTSEKYCG